MVTGIGVGFDDTGQSIIPVMADRFMVVPSVEGEGQYAFMVDSETGKVYIPGDLTVGGLLRAKELQVELIKALLLQAELGVFDEVRGLLMRADKLIVGGGTHSGIPVTKPKDSLLWPFDVSLHATSGAGPLTGSGGTLVSGGKFGGALQLDQGDVVTYDIPSGNRVTVGAYLKLEE